MHRAPLRPAPVSSPACVSNVPASQAHALERRHLLDRQQRAFQGTHAIPRGDATRRRPPG
ncbi:hypothetical protein OJF2_38830 [Aquisphaera giovannonii]|uniref:Uncharacterized protein n=1 Tax=Aquisphaera giovannonii TaxID=406548 RepID=A0A5B9W409_9BACT|nr:hypothetical protein [Aquisphaera giovannonii]QEH35332.1 hypothetical protein OJF2_38830 [Aquisphaera giovannonii]